MAAIMAATVLFGTVGCSGGGDDDGSAASTATVARTDATATTASEDPTATTAAEDPTATTADASAAPGRILVTSSAITGQDGKMLVVMGPDNASSMCARVDGDSWSLAEAPLTDRATEGPPCDDDETETTFEPGTHFVTATLFELGSQTPERTAAGTVTVVDGDAVVEIDGSKLSGTAAAGTPGRILVTSSEITGRDDTLLIALVQGNFGSSCVFIDSDTWDLSTPTAMTALPGDDGGPCGDGTPEVTFQAGDTVVTVAIIIPGQQAALASTQMLVTVDGDVELAVDGSLLSAP